MNMPDIRNPYINTELHNSKQIISNSNRHGWIKKRSHTQKSHPKVVNPRDIAGERQKKKKKKKKLMNMPDIRNPYINTELHNSKQIISNSNRHGWIKKRSHTQKSHPKVVNPRDIAGERQKKKKKKKKS